MSSLWNRSEEVDDVDMLKRQIEKLIDQNEQSEEMLRRYKNENEELKAKIRVFESKRTESQLSSSLQFCQTVADTLCEELVLLDEDINFISKIVKPPEVDPYTSDLGRKSKNGSPASNKGKEDNHQDMKTPPKSFSVSELLYEESLKASPQQEMKHIDLFSLNEEEH